jgi:hypothetical protein
MILYPPSFSRVYSCTNVCVGVCFGGGYQGSYRHRSISDYLRLRMQKRPT